MKIFPYFAKKFLTKYDFPTPGGPLIQIPLILSVPIGVPL